MASRNNYQLANANLYTTNFDQHHHHHHPHHQHQHHSKIVKFNTISALASASNDSYTIASNNYSKLHRHRASFVGYHQQQPPPPPPPAVLKPINTVIGAGIKLISKIVQATALTLLTLTLSSWIAYTTAAVASDGHPATERVAHTANSSIGSTELQPSAETLPFDFAALVLEASISSSTAPQTHDTDQKPPPDIASLPMDAQMPMDFANSSIFLSAIFAGTTHTNSSINSAYSGSSLSPTQNIGTSISSSASYDSTVNISIGSAEMKTEGEFIMPPLHAVVVSIILLIVILGTVVGNVLVCIAVCMVRKLRRPCNYLLVSLALSDLCVAVLVMPMALLYEVLEEWNFGRLLCDIWVSFDVLCCTASILNLCAISVDRYLAITKPLEYGVKRTPRRMMACVALVWLAAACISLPPLLILGNEHVGENGEPICTVCQNSAYQIYATLGSFYIPLSVMLFVYYQIFRAARRIVLEEKRAQTHLQHALNGTGSPPVPGNTELGSSGNGQRHSSVGNASLAYSTCGGYSGHGHHGSGGGVSGSTGLLGSPHHKKLRFQLAKEKKASTTLGIIMSAFTICWLPFFILALIRPFVESETVHVPQSLSSLFLWLGYANSLLNPIIYATLNRDFRKPFQEILYFRCSSLNMMMRENYYQDQYGEPPSQRVMLGDERHGARESFL